MAAALQTSLARANYEKDFASRWTVIKFCEINVMKDYHIGNIGFTDDASSSCVLSLSFYVANKCFKGDNIDRVLGGTVGTIHLGRDSTAGFDPVATAVEECYGTTRFVFTCWPPCLVFLESLFNCLYLFKVSLFKLFLLVGHLVWHSMIRLITLSA